MLCEVLRALDPAYRLSELRNTIALAYLEKSEEFFRGLAEVLKENAPEAYQARTRILRQTYEAREMVQMGSDGTARMLEVGNREEGVGSGATQAFE